MARSWLAALRPERGARLHFIGKVMLALLVPTSALALGSLKPVILGGLAVLAAISAALIWTDAIDRLSRNTIAVISGLILLTVMTGLQLIPLPGALVQIIAPLNADLWSRAFVPFNEAAPGWHPMSLDPVATQLQLVRALAYLCIFFAAVRVASTAEGVGFLELLVVVSGVVMAFAALAHPALGAESVFGIYRPRDAYSYQVGYYAPLLNVNHLAAYLNVAACVALARLLRNPRRKLSVVLAAALFLLAGTSVWAGSRGGMGGLLLGVVLTVILDRLTKRERTSGNTASVAILVGLGAVLLLAVGISDSARGELGNTGLSKLQMAREGLRLVPLSPWVGVGRGGFESIFPLVERTSVYQTSTHPENIIVEWVSEWGVPGTIAATAIFMWSLRPREMLTRVTPAAGAWAAVVATTVHDLVDFHLEVPGVTVLVVVCLAIVVVGRRRPLAEEHKQRRWRHSVWGLAGATMVAGIFVIRLENELVADDRVTFSRLAIDRDLSSDVFHDRLRAVIRRHPAEAFFPLMGAVRAQSIDHERVLPWVASALEKNPRLGRAHFVLARVITPRNPSQARLEYRLAWAYDSQLHDAIMPEAARLVESMSDALELTVDGIDGNVPLEKLVALISSRLPATATMLDDEILRRDPHAAGALLRRATAYQTDAANGEPWCLRPACEHEAIAAGEAAVAAAPTDCTAHLVLAKARSQSGDLKAIDALIQATDTVSNRLLCKEYTALLADSLGLKSQAAAVVDEIARFACQSDTESVDRFSWLGTYEDERGRDARAISFYKRAVELDPERENIQTRIYVLAKKNGLHSDAASAAGAMLRRHPDDPEWAARRDQAKEQARLNRLSPHLADPGRELRNQ